MLTHLLIQVVATYTSPGSAELVKKLADRIAALNNGSRCVGVQADLRNADSPQRIVAAATEAFGESIDILVNNAGCEVVKPLEELTADDFDAVYSLNVRAPMLMLQALRPHHLRRPGRVVNISSVGARAGFRGLSLYCSSKAALEGLTRCWAAELGDEGHTVNAVNPGPVQSDLLDNIPRDIIDMQKAQTPVEKRLGTVDDVAQIVAWLASEESRWVTGQVISASGGWALY
jgi:3-oxoacyl-[acyl-carrier protein] reductase